MFNHSGEASTPYLHILPAKHGEHFSTFQHRLMLSLHERSHPVPPPSSPFLSLPELPLHSLAAFNLDTIGQIPIGQIPIGQVPIGQIPIGQVPIGHIPIGQVPIGQIPIGQATIGQAPIGQAPIGQVPIGQAPIVQVPTEEPMEIQGNLPLPDPPTQDAHSIPLPGLELEGVKTCVIGNSCVGFLTTDGRAGRIRLQFLASPEEAPADSWTTQDEEVARQLRPQLEAEIPDFSRPPLGAGTTGMFGGLSTFRPLLANQLREETEPARTDLSTLLKVSGVDWAPKDRFSHIAALNSEILLVGSGQLFSWPLAASDVIPHPQSADLNLIGEEIVAISAGKTRASLITRSNRVATFYDASITQHTDCIHGNHLMRMLCHPLTPISLSEGEFLTQVSVSETVSCVRSDAGRVFWWGLIPSDRTSAAHSPSPGQAVRLGSRVSLRHGAQARDGDLLLRFSGHSGAAIGRLLSSNTGGSEICVQVLSGREEEEETWKLSETLFLEEERQPSVLGEVVAINQEFAAVDTKQTAESREGAIQLFPLSQLQTVSEASGDGESKRTSNETGVQRDPVCIVEPGEKGDESCASVGFRCLALSCHSQGPLLLLERVSDGQAFVINTLASPKPPDPPTVYSGSCKNKNSWTNATLEQECTPSEVAGLRTHSKFAASLQTNTPVLLDSHGYIRPIQSFYRLRPPFWHLPLPFHSLSLSLFSHGQREFHLVLCHPKPTGVMSCIEDSDFNRAKQFIDACIDQSESSPEQLFPAVKRAKVESEEVLGTAGLLERSCGNRNILHACILPADRKRKTKKKKKYTRLCFEEVRWNHYSKNSYKIHAVEVEASCSRVLSYLLSLPSLSQLVQLLLTQTDASGRTPFLLALLSQDLVAAENILEFVESLPLRQQPHLYQNAIAISGPDGLSPLQALLFNAALPYGQFGLKTLLITQPGHSSPLPKSLLAFLQIRYPSAYRCEALSTTSSPLSEESKVLPSPCTREAPPNRRTYSDTVHTKPHKTYLRCSDTLSTRHLVSFGSVWELRRAVCELNGASITTSAGGAMNYLQLQLEARPYRGEGVRTEGWEKELKKLYSGFSRSLVDTELLRVSLFKRLMEVCPSFSSGQENILSSLLHDKLLVQLLQDLPRLGKPDDSKLCFGSPLLSGPVPSGIHNAWGLGGLGGLGGLPTIDHSPLHGLKESDGNEASGEEVPIQSILEIVSGSWDVVSSAVLNPGGGTEPGHSERDSFVFSLLVDTPDSLLSTFLHTLFSKLEEVDSEKLATAFMSSDPATELEPDSALTVTVVQRFIQSLVRLYNRSISCQKHFLIPDTTLATDIPNRNAGLPMERRVTKVQYRIFRVLSSFRSLAVWEMVLAARALSWPLLIGNPKQYPKELDPPNVGEIRAFGNTSQAVKGLEWHFHCENAQCLSQHSSTLRQLPTEGVKLSLSVSGLDPAGPSRGARGGREKGERSDYWGGGGGGGGESASESEASGSEAETEITESVLLPLEGEGDEGEGDEGEGEEEEETYLPTTLAPRPPTGTSARVSWLTDTGEQEGARRGLGIYHHSAETGTHLNLNSGAAILARGFSRFLKSAVKLCLPDPDRTDPAGLDLPSLSLPLPTERRIRESVPEILGPVFSWSARLLDLAENQIEMGKRFSLESRYRPSRGAGELFEQNTSHGPRSDPKQYTDYLLSLAQLEAGRTLPVVDLSSYEHVAYLLDAQLYFASNWKFTAFGRPASQSGSAAPELSNGKDQAFFLRQSSLISSKHKSPAKPDFKTPLQRDIPLAQRPHLLKPEASYSTLFSAPSDTPASTPCDPPTPLHSSPLTYPQLEEKGPPQPWKLTAREITGRWGNVIEAFADLFSQAGPGAEPENFLFNRGGFTGRMARFHTLLNSIKNTGYYGGHCSLTIDRSELLKDSLTKLFSLDWAWQQALSVSFEGEAGGGDGVTAGFYTALANALKSSDKMPARTTSLFHEPGKLPEQATFYAPTPTLLTGANPLFVQRLSYYRAIGKFFGIAIYYKQPIPFLLTRHVVKYVLGRQISWHDVGFYNADLYEGLRRMLEHCQEENMSQESFQATYMLNFEVSVNDTICELKPGGKSIPVIPDNVHEYVRLYSMFLMVGCLKEELEELRKGFVTVIPTNFIRDLTAEDLQLILTGGSTVVSYSRLKKQTCLVFGGIISETDQRNFRDNFYRLIRHMKNTQRQQLLYFATGSALLASDSEMLSVYVQEGGYDNLPTAATCSRNMRIPCYKDYATLKKKVLEAIQCQDYAFS